MRKCNTGPAEKNVGNSNLIADKIVVRQRLILEQCADLAVPGEGFIGDLTTRTFKTDTIIVRDVCATGQVQTDRITEKTPNSGVDVDGVLNKDGTVTADTILTDAIDEKTPDAGVTIDDVLLKDGTITIDTIFTDFIDEKTPNAGVTIDDVLLKDGEVCADKILTDEVVEKTPNSGVIIEGVLIKDGMISVPIPGVALCIQNTPMTTDVCVNNDESVTMRINSKPGFFMKDGNTNTAIGENALLAVTTGLGNTTVGSNAGGSTTGDNNTSIGASATVSPGVDNNVVIGNSATSTVDDAVALGQGVTANVSGGFFVNHRDGVTPTAGRVGVYDVASKELVGLSFPTAPSQVLKSDMSGALTWETLAAVGETNTSSSAGGTSLVLPKVGVDLPFKGLTAGSNITLTPGATDITIAGPPPGEVNTVSSLGGTVPISLPKVGVNFPFRGLTAGSNITLTPSGTDVTIAGPPPGEVNTSSSLGGTEAIAQPKVGVNLPFKGLTAGSNITLASTASAITISGPPPGEVNTTSSLGGDEDIALAKVGVNFPFRGLTAGSNITLASSPTAITISGPPPGEVNTVSSLGGDISIALAKVGVNFPFRGLSAGANITLASSPTAITISGPAPGEVNTTSSLGGSVAIALAKVGVNFPFRGLTAGSNITLAPSGTDVTISGPPPGEVNTSSSLGGTVAIALPKVGVDLPFRGLTAGANITLTPTASAVTIAGPAPGEVNTTSSLGGDEAIALPKVGVNFPFKGLTAGANITLSSTGSAITIASSLGPGEANTASSAGGVSLVLPKSLLDLPFKGLTAGSNITLTPTATAITISGPAPGEVNTTSSLGGDEDIALAKVGVNFPFKGLTAGANITLSSTASAITIAGTAGTVTSVGLSAPTEFTVTGSPVTSSGTLTFAKASQLQNSVYAGPTSGTGVPTFRSLVAADVSSVSVSSFSGGSTGLTPAVATTGVVTLAGTLVPLNGGTGASLTLATGDVLYATSAVSMNNLGIGSAGQVLTVSGGLPTWATPAPSGVTSVALSAPAEFTVSGSPVTTTGTLTFAKVSQAANLVYASPNGSTGVPTFRSLVAADISSISVTSFSAGTTGFTPSTATTGAVTLSGSLTAVNGGTGQTGYAVGDILYANSTTTLTKLNVAANGTVLTLTGGVPTWAAPVVGGGGTVTSVGLSAPAEFTVSGSPVTTTGTLTFAKASQAANLVFASPNGSAGVPTFRSLVAADISSISVTSFSAGTTGLTPNTATSGMVTLAGTLTAVNGGTGQTGYAIGDILYANSTTTLTKLNIGTTGQYLAVSGGSLPTWITPAMGGTVTSVGLSAPAEFTVSGSPVTMSGTLTLAKASQAANLVFASPNGSAGVPTFRSLVAADISSISVTSFSAGTTGFTPSTATSGVVTLSGSLNAVNGGTGQSGYAVGDILYASSTTALSPLNVGANGTILTLTGGVPTWSAPATSGTVTSVALSAPSEFTVTGSPITSSGTLTIAKASQAANLIYASPNGSAGVPTFRSLVAADISSISVTSFSGGTTGFTPSTATSGVVTLAGSLNAVNGGTGQTGYTIGDILYANSTTTLTPLNVGANGQILTLTGGVPTWAAPAMGGGGTVTSVALSAPAEFTVTGSPITTMGTLTIAKASQAANLIYASPNGSAGVPTFRSIVAADISSASVTSFSAGTTGFTPNTATNGVVTLGGTLNAVNGGTGASLTFVAGDVLYATSPTTMTRLGVGAVGQVLTVSGASLPAWSAPPMGGGGTVTSVGLSAPAEFTVSGSPITTTGTLTIAKASQAANLIYASPNGSAGVPTFRSLVAADISSIGVTSFSAGTTGLTPNSATTGAVTLAGTLLPANGGTGSSLTLVAGDLLYATSATTMTRLGVAANGTVLTLAAGVPTWAAPAMGGGGTVTSVGLSAPAEFTVSGSPVTTTGTLTLTKASQLANIVYASPNGSSGVPTFRTLVPADITGGVGVTSVALSAPAEFTVSGSPVTGTGTLTLTKTSQAANLMYASPNGVSGVPTFRSITAADISSISVTSFGAGTTGFTPMAATNGVVTLSGTLNASHGGTGQSTYAVGQLLYADSTTTLAKLNIGTTGQYLAVSGSSTPTWITPAMGGSVTSVALSAPAEFTVSGSPVTTSGTLTLTKASQLANLVYASPNGSAGVPTFRSLVAADITGGVGVTTFAAGSTGLTPATATSGAVTLAGTLNATSGGTGQSGYAVGDLLYANTTSTLTKLNVAANGTVLTLAAGVPTWAAPAMGGGGTVTSVALSAPAEFTVSGSPVTTTGTLTITKASQAANTVYASPNGSAGVPTFRSLVAADITGGVGVTTFSAGTTGLTPNSATSGAITLSGVLNAVNGGTGTAHTFTLGDILYANTATTTARLGICSAGQHLSVSGSVPAWVTPTTGTVTSVALATPAEFTVSGSPITSSGTLTFAKASQLANIVYASPNGSAGVPTFRKLVATDITGGVGVTSVALSAPAEFTVTGSPVTTSGTLTIAKESQSANLVYASPNGSAGVPTFRSLVAADISSISVTSFSAGSTGFTPSTPTNGAVTLVGTLNAANGGTGSSLSFTIGDILYASSATVMAKLPASIAGRVLTSNGVGVAPSYQAVVNTFSAGSTGLTPNSATSGAVTLSGILNIANGGTAGTATPTAGAVAYGTGSAYAFTVVGTTGQRLISNGSGAPTWAKTTFIERPNFFGADVYFPMYVPALPPQTGSLPGEERILFEAPGFAWNNGTTGSTPGHLSIGAGCILIGSFSQKASLIPFTGVGGVGIGLLAKIGTNDVAIGPNAGSSSTGGGNNILIGNNTQKSASGVSDEVTVGNSSNNSYRIYAASWVNVSDARDKKDVKPISSRSDFVDKLKPVDFTWNMRDGGKVDIPDTGFIAQDLQAVQQETGIEIPGLVNESNPDQLMVGATMLIPTIIKALQEANEEIRKLKAEVALLKQ